MKRKGIVLLVFLLVLFIVPVNPSLSSLVPDRINDADSHKDFALSADGAESSESITSFAETLADDVWYFPDGDLNTSIQVASAGKTVADSTGGDYTDTQSMGTDLYTISETVGPYDGYIYLNFTVSVNYGQTINLNFFGCYDVITASTKDIEVYDGATWDDVGDMVYDGTFPFYDNGWTNVTLSPDYIISEIVMIRAHVVDTVATHVYINYCEIALAWPLLSDSDNYAESFVSVDDWTTSDTSISTDGDVGTITENGAGSTGRAYASFSSTNFFEFYYEFRIVSMTATTANLEFWDGADYHTLKTFTAAGTQKGIISAAHAATMQRIGFLVGSEGGNIKPDYLRISRSNESGGWQHDGSTIDGVSNADLPYEYEEDMSVVTDWALYNTEGGESISTDGDIGTFVATGEMDNDQDLYYSYPATVLDADWTYASIRFKMNSTDADYWSFWLLDEQSPTRTGIPATFFTLTDTTDWLVMTMHRDDMSISLDFDGNIKTVMINGKCDEDVDVELEVDYILIGRQIGDTGTIATDGDELTLTADADGSIFVFDVDTTATQAELATSYYPFLALDFNDADSADYVMVETYDGSNFFTVRDNATIGTDPLHANTQAVDSYIQQFWITVAADAVVRLDWIKSYSIANFTSTLTGDGIDDFLYVSSGILYSTVDSGTIELNLDPALSVASASYQVYNLTTSGTAPEFSQYVASWSTYSANTRGATSTGTVTDLKLRFDASEILSAIKFIEDGTAPTVIRSFATPDPADDDETVTLSAVVEDSVLVYEVNFNAITYPVGFSDVDYSATESTDNLWTYSFSTLDAGYYCFKILGSDGANLNALTEYGYISLSVREAAIIINPITFFGVGDDFTQMQISFEINKDCTFTIYEASDSVAETDTHTGSVSEGWDNIAWDKLTTTDTAVNFSISFVSGSLSTWINGSYAVAQVTFDVVLSDKTTTFDYVYLEGESTKAAAYAVYDINNVLRSSGTIPEGSFALSFEIWNKKSLTETFYGVKFTNGSSTDWINGTYYADDPEEYKGGGVVTVPPWWQDPMTWVIIGGFAALMFIATSGQKVGNLPNAPKGLK